RRVVLGPPLRPAARPRRTGITEPHVEPARRKLAPAPTPAGRRLKRARLQLSLPSRRPVSKSLAPRRQPLLDELAAVAVQHRRLEHLLVNVERCVHHLAWASFVDPS